MTVPSQCQELECSKTKGFVQYENGMHYCHGSLKHTCQICGYSEALLFSKFLFSTVKCERCNSELKFHNGVFIRKGSVIEGVRQE